VRLSHRQTSVSNPKIPHSHITFPRALEEEPHDEDLQASHRHHHEELNHAEPEDPALRTPYGAEIAVLSRAEVLLLSVYGAQL
jgi:hypothetical protein